MAEDDGSRVEAWKIFLQGRIAEEKGDQEAALRAYDEALAVDPSNEAFRKARANALTALGRSNDAAASRIARQYEHLAAQLSGPDDDPEAWIPSLERLLNSTDRIEATAPPMIVW